MTRAALSYPELCWRLVWAVLGNTSQKGGLWVRSLKNVEFCGSHLLWGWHSNHFQEAVGGVCLCYIRHEILQGEQKSLQNTKCQEDRKSVHGFIYIMESQFWLLSSVKFKYKNNFFFHTSLFMWETRGSLSITNPAVKVKRRKHFLAAAGACNSALQPASPLLPLLSAGWAWTEAKAQNVFFPGISCRWGPLCFYGVTQDPPGLLSTATFCLSTHAKAWLWLTPKEQKIS